MGRSYSDDLRARVAGFVEAGHSRRAAARHFGVSESFAVKLLQRATRLKTLRPARQGRPPGSRLDAHGAFLVAQVEATPDHHGYGVQNLAEGSAKAVNPPHDNGVSCLGVRQ